MKILKQNSNIFHWEITCFENHLSDIHTNPNKTLLIIVISRINIFYSLIDTEYQNNYIFLKIACWVFHVWSLILLKQVDYSLLISMR